VVLEKEHRRLGVALMALLAKRLVVPSHVLWVKA
jgi:hypothetical protein